jgi:hypothetical protein
VKDLAHKIVDTMLDENWFRDRWEDVKAATGIGSDTTGLGKNTEKGWKPSYARSRSPAPKQSERVRKARTRQGTPSQGDTKVWELD